MPPRSYATPEGFRQALETRVRAAAGPSGMGRFRQVLVYDRFLARVFQHLGDRAVAIPVLRVEGRRDQPSDGRRSAAKEQAKRGRRVPITRASSGREHHVILSQRLAV